jgi:hypothetical protein
MNDTRTACEPQCRWDERHQAKDERFDVRFQFGYDATHAARAPERWRKIMSDSMDTLRSYVRTALALQGYAFSEERVAEITVQFARIAAIAEILLPADSKLPDTQDLGTAAVFRP